MDYETELEALHQMLHGYANNARKNLRELFDEELDKLTDALDTLAALVDEEAIRRAEKRR